jgi:hypothetical protein
VKLDNRTNASDVVVFWGFFSNSEYFFQEGQLQKSAKGVNTNRRKGRECIWVSGWASGHPERKRRRKKFGRNSAIPGGYAYLLAEDGDLGLITAGCFIS